MTAIELDDARSDSHSFIDDFLAVVQQQLDEVADKERDSIRKAAQIVADVVENDGIIYTFGTGHSHCAAEEVVYRAGGLAPVDAILEPSLTGTTDVVKSEQMERLEGVGRIILDHRRVGPGDVLIVISNSGRNGAPIDIALEAKARAVPTIAITSLRYSSETTPRHSSGRRLYEVVDVAIDNGTVFGDAAVEVNGVAPADLGGAVADGTTEARDGTAAPRDGLAAPENGVAPMGPTSNIMALFVLHAIMGEAATMLLSRGITPPVFWSGNLDDAKARNQALIDRYWNRIRMW